MATEQRLFGDYQSVTQPFEMEESAVETPPDQGGGTAASETPPEGGQVKTPGEESSGSEGKGKGEYDLEGFNKFFESDFKDIGSLKDVLQSSSKIDQLQKQLEDEKSNLKVALEKSTKYDELIDNLDEKKLYGDPEMYAYFKLREKYPDKDPGILSQIKSAGFDSLSDMDKLLLADKLKVRSNISDSVRTKAIMQRLGIEADDLSDIDDTDRYKLASAVADQIELFNEIRDFKPEPLKFDFGAEKESRKREREERRTTLKSRWEPLAKSLLKNYEKAVAFSRDEKGDYVESFSFAVDDEFKEKFAEPYLKSILDSNMEANEENLKIAANHLDERFKIMNYDRIVNEAIKYGKTLSEDKAHNEIHSDKPQNTTEALPQNTEGKTFTMKEVVKQRIAARQGK